MRALLGRLWRARVRPRSAAAPRAAPRAQPMGTEQQALNPREFVCKWRGVMARVVALNNWDSDIKGRLFVVRARPQPRAPLHAARPPACPRALLRALLLSICRPIRPDRRTS